MIEKLKLIFDTLLKQRATTEFLHSEGVQNEAKILRRFLEGHVTDTMDVRNVRQWVFKTIFSNKGEMSIHEALRSGRPITATTEQHHTFFDDIN